MSLVENFKLVVENMTPVPSWQHFLLGGVLQRSSFLDNLKLLDKKLDLQKTPTGDNMFILSFFHLGRDTNCCPK
jgi:hypothetical protein